MISFVYVNFFMNDGLYEETSKESWTYQAYNKYYYDDPPYPSTTTESTSAPSKLSIVCHIKVSFQIMVTKIFTIYIIHI